MEDEFPIGTRFWTRGKHPRLCTVIDVYTTCNSKNEVVKKAYVANHDFMGQKIISEYPATSIKMGLINDSLVSNQCGS